MSNTLDRAAYSLLKWTEPLRAPRPWVIETLLNDEWTCYVVRTDERDTREVLDFAELETAIEWVKVVLQHDIVSNLDLPRRIRNTETGEVIPWEAL